MPGSRRELEVRIARWIFCLVVAGWVVRYSSLPAHAATGVSLQSQSAAPALLSIEDRQRLGEKPVTELGSNSFDGGRICERWPADAGGVLLEVFGGIVVVADDEPVNQEFAKMLLAVDTADDGEKTVLMAQRKAYAVLFMDMQMPCLNGLAATLQIRQTPGYCQTLIIAITANAFADDKAQCFEVGMSDFLVKPFTPDALFAILLRALTIGQAGMPAQNQGT